MGMVITVSIFPVLMSTTCTYEVVSAVIPAREERGPPEASEANNKSLGMNEDVMIGLF